ncbi:hypothetical protein PILCRDRAFT_811915 [Piloderma croceum F 1598]|uniref:Uncharacterized protein n=1 Tax=Piloderma croceum (strain F 1598) TaxID=765440 RepID=A0A0C3BUI9_PILCF|nr:hypothetical protein PILCRDRAFT_811915 [Piloderma croceum F 1598]
MSSLKPRLTVLAALCSLVAITGPTPVQGSYMPMHSIDSSTGLISHSASMMSLSESTSMSHHQLESQTLPRAESSSEPSSRKLPRRALDDRLPLRARRVSASRKDMKKYKITGHGNGKGRKSYKKKRITSWNTLNPILSLSEWIGDCARPPKFMKRGLNNNVPPLLQQATVNEKGQENPRTRGGISDEEQDADGFVPVRHRSFSTFASRWNKGNVVRAKKEGRKRDAEHQPSSVVIPNTDEGDLYFLSSENRKRERDEAGTPTRVNNDRYNSRPFVQRKREEDGGVPGTIDIMSTVYGSNKGARIASLVLDIANSTTDNSTTPHFVLDASNTNQTQIYLVKAPSAPASHAAMSIDSDANTNQDSDLESGDIPVMLQLPIFDATQASMVRYCTTFDPSPGGPGGPLTAEPCFPWFTNSDSNTNASQTHKSQAFTFNENTGVVKPMWFNGEDDGTDHGNYGSVEDDGYQGGDEDEDEAAQAPVANEDPETPVGENMASITSLRARDTVDNSTAPAPAAPSNSTSHTGSRNVTLVFTPATPEVSPQQINSDPKAVGVVASSSTGSRLATGTTSMISTSTLPNTAAAMETNSAISSSLVVSAAISATVSSSSSLSAADIESTSAPGLSSTCTTDTSTPSATASSVVADANIETDDARSSTATTDSSTPLGTSSVVNTSASMNSSVVTAADIGSTFAPSLSSTASTDSSSPTTLAPSSAMMAAAVGSTSIPNMTSTAPNPSSTSAVDTSSSLSVADISTTAAVTTDTNVGPSVTTATVVSTSTAATLASGLPPAGIQSRSVVTSDTASTVTTGTPSTEPTSISSVSAANVQSDPVVPVNATDAPMASTPFSSSMVVSSVAPSAAGVRPTSVASSSPVSNLPSSSMAAASSSASPGPFGPQDVGITSSSTGVATPTSTAGVSTALPPSTSINAEAIASIIADAYEAGFDSASPAAASAAISVSASATGTDMPNPLPSSRVMMAAGNLPSYSSAAEDPSSTSSPAPSSMTPVSTAPYQWMFTPDSPL